jgi:hypothetical protein
MPMAIFFSQSADDAKSPNQNSVYLWHLFSAPCRELVAFFIAQVI